MLHWSLSDAFLWDKAPKVDTCTWGDFGCWIYMKEAQKAIKKRKTAKKSNKYLTSNPSSQSNFTTICELALASRRSVKGVLRGTRPPCQGSGALRYQGSRDPKPEDLRG